VLKHLQFTLYKVWQFHLTSCTQYNVLLAYIWWCNDLWLFWTVSFVIHSVQMCCV